MTDRTTDHSAPDRTAGGTADDGLADDFLVEDGLVDDGLVEVVLLQVPVRVWARSHEQSEALQREFALVTADPSDVPARLLDLMGAVRQQHGQRGAAQEEQLLDAVDAGLLVLERLVYRVPVEVGPVIEQIGRLFDEADAYCRSGEHLLTMAADEECARFRAWFLGQFVDQLAGRPPVPWTQHPRT